MPVAPRTLIGRPCAWLLVTALGLSAPQAGHAQDFWWLRVAQSLTGPVDVATVAQVAEALPPGTLIGPLPPPIADPTSLALDARQPPVPRAVNALAPYLGAARAARAANVATATGPWFLETALAITDLNRVHFVDGMGRGEHIDELDLSRAFDFAEVRRVVAETRAGLIYVDALDDVLGSGHDGRGQVETRRALAPIRVLARETGASVLGLRHPTKRVALGPALNSGNGSIAYGAVCRAPC